MNASAFSSSLDFFSMYFAPLRTLPADPLSHICMQSTPAPGNGWHHGLWLPNGQFASGEHLWLQLVSVHNQAILPLPESNLQTSSVTRHPLRLA